MKEKVAPPEKIPPFLLIALMFAIRFSAITILANFKERNKKERKHLFVTSEIEGADVVMMLDLTRLYRASMV